jgi:hypothetical protein
MRFFCFCQKKWGELGWEKEVVETGIAKRMVDLNDG